jgi:hypothetical protein
MWNEEQFIVPKEDLFILLLMSVFSQTFFTLVGSDFMTLSFFTAGHS